MARIIKIVFFFMALPFVVFGQSDTISFTKKNYWKVYYADSIQIIKSGVPYSGKDTFYFKSGEEKIKVVETYIDGYKVELQTFFDNGNPECYWQWKMGKRDGINRRWFKSGQLMFDYFSILGKDIGTIICYFESGGINYIENNEIGIKIHFHKNGKVKSKKSNYSDSTGCKGIEIISWFEDGQLSEKQFYNCGKQTQKLYFNDSTLARECTIVGLDLFFVGKYTDYYPNGKIKLEAYYENGNNTI
ncbi:MAG: hypothetical protein IPH89_02970 [Bacteroidetes bacterium]|nr:hypothetical protein [Bacteroidota bacterium]